MAFDTWFAFAVASSLLLVIPGPTILTVISYSIGHGQRSTLPLILAVMLGDSTALCASLMGLGALLTTSVFWFTLIKVFGGVYLLLLGITMLLDRKTPSRLDAATAGDSQRRLFLNTYLVTALNPKGIVFFLAFLPQFVQAGENAVQSMILLALTFVALATLNTTAYALFATSTRRLLANGSAARRFKLLGGSMLTAAGLWTLLARRPTFAA